MTFQNSILAGVTLIREAIQSQNYDPGVAGWQVAADGTAEFSDLTIRSSDGSGSTVTIVNGVITISDGGGATVVQIDADGYRLYDADGDLVAQITLDAGGALGGFYARNFEFPENTYAFLSGGVLTLGPVDNAQADTHGFVDYSIAPAAAPPYAAVTMSSGALDLALDDPARVQLVSERGQRPKGWIDGGSSALKADMEVTGKIIADNLRAGTAQTPSPGGSPGQTSVAVVFSSPMDAVPAVSVTLNSTAANLNTSNIRWAITSRTATGFTINCWRDTNAATNFDYVAIST